VLGKAGMGKPPGTGSLLDNKQKLEIISSLDDLDFHEQTDIIEYMAGGQSALENSLYAEKIKDTCREHIKKIYNEYISQIQYLMGFDYFRRTYDNTAKYDELGRLNWAVNNAISNDLRGFVRFLKENVSDPDITPEELHKFGEYIRSNVIIPEFKDKKMLSPERNYFDSKNTLNFGKPIDKTIYNCMEKLPEWYKQYEKSPDGKEKTENDHKTIEKELLEKCTLDQSVIDALVELHPDLSHAALVEKMSKLFGLTLELKDPLTEPGKRQYLTFASMYIGITYACVKERWNYDFNVHEPPADDKNFVKTPPIIYGKHDKLSYQIRNYLDYEVAKSVLPNLKTIVGNGVDGVKTV
jgi:hypothetical protein